MPEVDSTESAAADAQPTEPGPSTDPADAAPDPIPDPDGLRSDGTARPITIIGDAVLAARCRAVTEFGEPLRLLVRDMFASMYAARGVGLAANQIGVDTQVFVIDCPDDAVDRLIGHAVNPQFRVLDDTPRDGEEGCLSVPGPRATFPRPAASEVTGVDWAGRPVRLIAHGLAARCLQHETDHLAGHLYLDRLDDPQRAQVLGDYAADSAAADSAAADSAAADSAAADSAAASSEPADGDVS